ncbi:MAG TPA: pentapeptide repeat-containing protein [Conexibacter sp.]|nr:pentapeptide repeat-containing protein [Conexibacter sp.]
MADGQGAPTGSYVAAVERIRSTAQWVLASLAAVGAVLVAGLGLTSLSQIDVVWRLCLAVGLILLALAVVGWEIAQTAKVLAPSRRTFGDVVAAEETGSPPPEMAEVFERRSDVLRGTAASFGQLDERRVNALAARTAALEANYAAPDDTDKEEAARAAVALAQLYTQTTEGIVLNVAYHEIEGRLDVRRQVVGAGVVAAAVAAFALLLAWPQAKPDRIADFHGARLVGVDLSGTSLVGASFSKMTLTDVDLHGADLRGADFRRARLVRVDLRGATANGAHWDHAAWKGSTCPDGTASDNAGGRCRGHLRPDAGE